MKLHDNLVKLSKESILERVTPLQIYSFYIKNLVLNKAFNSPLRKDNSPSFMIRRNSLFYKDFATGDYGDCFQFVMKYHNVDFIGALTQIAYNFNIQDEFIIVENVAITKKIKKTILDSSLLDGKDMHESGVFNIKVKLRELTTKDIKYWESYGIDRKLLKIGQIYPISHFFLNDRMYVADEYAYVFLEKKDGVLTKKIYQPFSKKKKWINNNNHSIWELWMQLPATGDNLIITSSRKDSLAIRSVLNIPAVALQSETTMPKLSVLKELKRRFKNIYLLYDNDFEKTDNWGQIQAQKILEFFPDIINLVIPKIYRAKDFSDLVFDFGVTRSKIIFENEFYNHFT